jgi:hypothetical protein
MQKIELYKGFSTKNQKIPVRFAEPAVAADFRAIIVISSET